MDEHVLIRPYRDSDYPAIREITVRIWDIGVDNTKERVYGFKVGGKPWQERKTQTLQNQIGAHPDNWFVSDLQGRVVGFCSFSIDNTTGIGQVGHNGVHPDYQGQGYGSNQLRFVLKKLREGGMKIAEVWTVLNEEHAPARSMYESAGFQSLSESRLYYRKL